MDVALADARRARNVSLGGSRASARPALARRLVLIHAVVRGGQQRLVGFAVVREYGGPDADAERQALAGTPFEVHGVDALLQLDPLLFRLLGAASGEHDNEFVARVADADVVR